MSAMTTPTARITPAIAAAILQRMTHGSIPEGSSSFLNDRIELTDARLSTGDIAIVSCACARDLQNGDNVRFGLASFFEGFTIDLALRVLGHFQGTV